MRRHKWLIRGLHRPIAVEPEVRPPGGTSNQQPPVSPIHKLMAAPDGPSDAVAQMIAGIVPVALNAGVAEECGGYVAMGRSGQRAVERAERETQSPVSRLDGEVSGRKLSLGVKMIETSECIEPLARPLRWKHSIRHQTGRLQQAALGQRQLQMMTFLPQENVLIASRPLHQDDCATGQRAKIHCVGRVGGNSSHRQHMGALAGRPEDACFRRAGAGESEAPIWQVLEAGASRRKRKAWTPFPLGSPVRG